MPEPDPLLLHIMAMPGMNLTSYEVKALISLAQGADTPGSVAAAAGIPRTKAYEVLNGLASKAIVTEREGRPKTYRVNDASLKAFVARLDGCLEATKAFVEGLVQSPAGGFLDEAATEIADVLPRLGFRIESTTAGLICAISLSGVGVDIMLVGSPTPADLDRLKGECNRHLSRPIMPAIVHTGDVPAMFTDLVAGTAVAAIRYNRGGMQDVLNALFEDFEHAKLRFEELHKKCASSISDFQHLVSSISADIAKTKKLFPGGSLADRAGLLEAQLPEVMEREGALEVATASMLSKFGTFDSNWNYCVKKLENCLEGLSSLRGEVEFLLGAVGELSDQAELLKRGTPGFRQLSEHPPLFPVGADVVGQMPLKQAFQDFLNEAPRRPGLTIGVLMGEHGYGRTLLVRYYAGRINRESGHNTIAVWTDPGANFLYCFNGLLEVARSQLVTRGRFPDPALPAACESLHQAISVFQRILMALRKRLYWFIDDLDSVLNMPQPQARVFLAELTTFLNRFSSSPLVMVFSLTPDSRHLLESAAPWLSRRVQSAHIFRIRPFGIRDLAELVERMKIPKGWIGEPNKSLMLEVLRYTAGNPRKVIRMLNHLYQTCHRRALKPSQLEASELLA